MKREFNLREITLNRKQLYFGDLYIGDCIRDDDGFFYFWDYEGNKGCWSSFSLRGVAKILDELNKEWNEIINKEFDKDGKN